MRIISFEKQGDIFRVLVLSVLVVIVLFLWQGHFGFNLGDEGFLWYGAQRVVAGEVPIRDFMAYDPGRYYWSAAFMALWGDDGIMSLRVAVAVFQVLGLFIALLLIARSKPESSVLYLLLSAVTLVIWMYPRHKLFDISLSILLIGVIVYLIENPSRKRYFIAGFCVGMIAVFGRNHGLYGVAAGIFALFWIALGRDKSFGIIKPFAYGLAGILTGYLPVLLMAAGISGFAQAFWDSIRFFLDARATNLPLPVPWPWTVPFEQVGVLEAFRGLMVGLFFMVLIASGIIGLIWVYWQRLMKRKVSTPLVAAIFLILPYAHFAYSRADINHLAQGIFPLLLAMLVVVANLPAGIRRLSAMLLMTTSLLIMLPVHPGWQCYMQENCETADVAGNELSVSPATAANLTLLKSIHEQYASDRSSIVVAPFWPGAYPVLRRRSPIWEIYPLFPRSDNFQRQEIARIEAAAPGFIMLDDASLDGRDELRFSNTHPLVVEYIRREFEPVVMGFAHRTSQTLYLPRHSPE